MWPGPGGGGGSRGAAAAEMKGGGGGGGWRGEQEFLKLLLTYLEARLGAVPASQPARLRNLIQVPVKPACASHPLCI